MSNTKSLEKCCTNNTSLSENMKRQKKSIYLMFPYMSVKAGLIVWFTKPKGPTKCVVSADADCELDANILGLLSDQ